MSNLKEQFVTKEIAIELEKLGFNKECFSYFELKSEAFDQKELVAKSSLKIYLPLWQQVIDWFLIEHNIWINVDTSLIKFYKDDELQPSKFQFIIEDLENRDSDYMFHSADKELFYFDYKYAREQAILKAIELIKNEL